MFTSYYLVLIITFFCPSGLSQWSYDGPNGPASWPSTYNQCDPKNNWRQSPIDINNNFVYFDPSFSVPSLGPKYYQAVSGSFFNSNETVKFVIPRTENAYIYIDNGAARSDKYIIDSGHFHWGENLHAGSEHSIDGRRYFGELHLVHYLAELDNLTMAMDIPDAIAVIAVFLEVAQRGEDDTTAFTYLLNKISSIRNPGETTNIQLTLRDLLPTKLDKVYNYKGGLTTPTCNGVLQWMIIKDTMKITSALLSSAFLQNAPFNTHHEPQGDNFRPQQDLGQRLIRTNERGYKWIAAGGSTALPMISTLLIMASSAIFSLRSISVISSRSNGSV